MQEIEEDSLYWFESKDLSNISSQKGFETLKIINDTLKDLSDEKHVNVKYKGCRELTSVQVGLALEELFSLDENLAFIVKLETGNIFSDDLIEEDKSCFDCLSIVKKIIELNGGFLQKPIIILTDDCKVVILLPSNYQCDTKKEQNSVMLYFIDLATGLRDLRKQTLNSIFLNYLKNGIHEKKLAPLFGSKLFLPDDISSVANCCPVDKPWWCIYYSIMVVFNGNDNFISDSLWSKKNTSDLLKLILTTYISTLSNLNENMTTKDEATINLDDLCDIDEKIDMSCNTVIENIKKRIEKLKQTSLKEKINELKFNETLLKEKEKILTEEIEVIEATIKNCEILLPPRPNTTITTDERLKRFLTGEEKDLIQIQIEKKNEKSRSLMLEHDEKRLEEYKQQEVKKLKEIIGEKETEILKKTSEYQNIISQRNQNNMQIETEQNKIKRLKNEIIGLKENKVNCEKEKRFFENIISEINQIRISNYQTLLNRLLKDDIKLSGDKLLDIKKTLERTDSQIDSISKSLKTTTKSLENETGKKKTIQIQLNSEYSNLKNLEEKMSKLQSEKTELQKEYDSYGISKIFYFVYLNNLYYKIEEKKKLISNYENQIDNQKKNISNIESTVNSTQKYIDEQKSKLTGFEKTLKEEEKAKEQHIQSLKNLRDDILKTISGKYIENINQKYLTYENTICSKTIDIETSERKISGCQREKKILDDKLGNCELSLGIIKKNRDDISQKINYLIDLNKNGERKLTKILTRPLNDQVEVKETNDLMDSHIIFNKQKYFELMSLCKLENQKWKLLYRGSRDGFKAKDFHRNCDGKSNSLTIIKTDRSFIFGGYTGAKWSSNKGFISDENAFIFSFVNHENSPVLVKCTEPNEAIYCSDELGPCFGNDDIRTVDESNLNSKNRAIFGYSFEDNIHIYGSYSADCFLAGSKYFRIKEIEVFCKDYPELTNIELMKIKKQADLNTDEVYDEYEKFNAIAVNMKINMNSFCDFLINRIGVFQTDSDLLEMRKLCIFIFKQFDRDDSGELEFDEFLRCTSIFRFGEDRLMLIFTFIFEYADQDKNEKLDTEEIKSLFNQFPTILRKSLLEKKINDFMHKNRLKSISKAQFIKILDDEDSDYSEDSEIDDYDEDYSEIVEMLTPNHINEKTIEKLIDEFQQSNISTLAKMNKNQLHLLFKEVDEDLSTIEINKLYYRIVQDENGCFCFDDFINSLSARYNISGKRILRNIFNDLDSSKDDQISYHEWKRIGKIFTDINSQLDTAFNQVDKNKNGKINFKEFMIAFKNIDSLIQIKK